VSGAEHFHTGLENPERTQPTDPRGIIEEALTKTADITAVQLTVGMAKFGRGLASASRAPPDPRDAR
jgi:hypothetical protein